MNRISSYEELKNLAKEYAACFRVRMGETVETKDSCQKKVISVCGGTGCKSSDSMQIIEKLREEVQKAGLADTVEVTMAGCFGFCEKGPIVKIYPDNTFYIGVTPSDAAEIVSEDIVGNRKVEHLLYEEPTIKQKVSSQDEMSFYKKQMRIALRNCGLINPEKISESIANEGYQALAKCITEYTPDEVIHIISESGLRGRGGGGFPTGKKWAFAKAPDRLLKPIYTKLFWLICFLVAVMRLALFSDRSR